MERELRYANKLAKMIQCETVSVRDVPNTEKFDALHEVLKALFPLVFSKCEVTYIDSSLLIKMKGRGKGEPILFMSHQDVVEATGDWKYPPFSGEIVDGVIWGRGTVDTKGSLFCIFQAVEEALEEGYIPNVDLYIASSSTEEVAGDGAPKTVELLKGKGVHLQLLVDEGGMIKYEPMKGVEGLFAMVGTLEKGTGNVRFIARSKGGHASAPTKMTPLVRLGCFMKEVEEHDPLRAKISPTVIETFRRFAPYTKGSLGFIFKHAKALSPLLNRLLPKVNPIGAAMIKTTVAFTMAHGADGMNVLPEEAWVNANIRFIQHEGVEATLAKLKRIADKYDIEMVPLQCTEPQEPVDFNGKGFRIVEETINELFPEAIVSPYAMTGGTDAYFYYPVTENAIRFAPLEINEQQYRSIHGLNENINISTLPKGVDFYKTLMKKF